MLLDHRVVMKKPAAVIKKPAAPTDKAERKRVHSKAYHAAQSSYVFECKGRGIPPDPEEFKIVGRKAGAAALADLDASHA